jgi:hypothetical protein
MALVAVLAAAGVAHADEIRLKDGSKITGTIVGYENDSFKIETSYGFAFVRKDKVAEIIPTAPKPAEATKDAETKTKKEAEEVKVTPPAAAPSPATPAAPKPTPAVLSEPVPAAKPETPKPVAATVAAPAPPAAPKTPAKNEAIAAKQNAKSDCPAGTICDSEAPTGVTVPTPVVAPVVVEPPPIKESVQGNQYINYTYGFEIYKPPSWALIAADRKALPNAVAALGTGDGNTLLIVGRETAKNTLDAQATATDKALSEIYENYRQISTRRTTIDQFPAVESQSHGSADGHDWSVVTLTVVRGGDAFTLLGMTWAESDLIQVQENILAKVVNSLAFSVQ